jgi:hypothetical protein
LVCSYYYTQNSNQTSVVLSKKSDKIELVNIL